MPVPIPPTQPVPLFPPLTKSVIDSARTSAWYDAFAGITIPTTIVDLDDIGEKAAFLESGSEDESESESSESGSEAPVYRLPRLNEEIRLAIKKYGGAVFPKLNWTSPKDAAFILPVTPRGPLYCTTPADVFLILKSSDFIGHALDPSRAYEGAEDLLAREAHAPERMKIELVLREHVDMNPAREVRCFVRDDVLLGISQRDLNFYDHLQPADTRREIVDRVRAFWEDDIRGKYQDIFDLYLTDWKLKPILIDFHPYRPSTDPLLFTYQDLQSLSEVARLPPPPSEPPTPSPTPATTASVSASTTGLTSGRERERERPRLPVLRIIDSRAHPAANRAAPEYGGNMMPIEMVEMSQGRTVQGFRAAWADAIRQGMTE
ncbi:hypothetical protein JCM24511_08263 [Saitozyma sp. JCM 24511]|nr:hypothetical protein JCM24511_08263 [Saitozyma sp. JCM 24511]